jgi:LPS O-antigen subunit length determinant protein (WzzB/FepE family)|tara:strand:- start:14 stop:511 length:498 start_codon:yes stop_codon:yes gene_type:complete
MCNPTAIAALQGIVQYGEQQQQAEANRKAANASYVNDVRQLNLRQRQEEEAEAQRGFEADVQAARDQATAKTAAGESGVAGLSVDALMTDILRQNLFDDTKAGANLDMTKAQIAQEKEGAKAGRQSRINQVPYPNFAATALQIGGTAYENGYFDKKPKRKGGAGR